MYIYSTHYRRGYVVQSKGPAQAVLNESVAPGQAWAVGLVDVDSIVRL